MPISFSETSALLNFLETGELGPIRLGMTQDEVRAVIGEPSDTSNPDAIFPPLEIYWYTQWLELTFDAGVLVYVSLRYKWQQTSHWPMKHLKLPSAVRSPWATRVGSWNFVRFKQLLFRNQRAFWLYKDDDGSIAIQCSNGSIVFDHRRRCGLYSIGYSTMTPNWRFKGSELTRPPKLFPDTTSRGRQR